MSYSFNIQTIGIIHSPFSAAEGTPIQSVYAANAKGTVVIYKQYEESLLDIEGFERVWLIYYFDRVCSYKPQIIPYRDTKLHGLFATRSPCRPSPIGMTAVRLLKRENNLLQVEGIDILDKTPLIDIKPYVAEFDSYPSAAAGWFAQSKTDRTAADDRFHNASVD